MKNESKFHTDIKYYSKSDLKMDPKYEYTKELWDEVVEYREKYSFDLPLLFNSKRHVRLTQTPWILQKEIKMISTFSQIQQEMLTNVSTRYSSTRLLDDIEHKSFVSDIHWMMNEGAKKNVVSRTIIENIVVQGEEPETADERKILKTYDLLVDITNRWVSPREIAKLFFGFKEFNNVELEDIHSSLVETIKSDKINSLLTKISATTYAILGNEMFGENSYNVTVLSLLSLLRTSYKSNALKGVSFWPTFDYFKHDIQKSIDEVKKDKGDLTYLTTSAISVIMYAVRLSSEQMEAFIKNESKFNSLSERDKNKSIEMIRRENPSVSKRQASFFVAHNTPRSSYTIDDFKKYIGSSYETARYSLDNLVEQGFYKKTLVGKKYVYKPIKQ